MPRTQMSFASPDAQNDKLSGVTITLDHDTGEIRVTGAKRVTVTHTMRDTAGNDIIVEHRIIEHNPDRLVECWVEPLGNLSRAVIGHAVRVHGKDVEVVSGSTIKRNPDVIATWSIPEAERMIDAR